jgi:hypothetical protein
VLGSKKPKEDNASSLYIKEAAPLIRISSAFKFMI